MSSRPNVLLILADQMRADCLSCADHPVVRTPNLDRLAASGVRFENAYVHTAVCGPSRMCMYTGRYIHAHRSSFNNVPLPASERTIADYLREVGYETVVIGRTHHQPDIDLIKRVYGDVPKDQVPHLLNAGFREPGTSDHDEQYIQQAYAEFRAALPGDEEFDDTIRTPDGEILDLGAWVESADYRSSAYPLRTRPEHLYDSFKTDKAIDFIKDTHDKPWLLFLSLDKPHPPYVIPEPYSSMYDRDQIPAPLRCEGETDGHPIIPIFRRQRRSLPLDNEWVWRNVRASYYGSITYVDDQVGRVLDAIDDAGLADNTAVLFVSDHGEYVGDHWLVEKGLFYEQAIRIPFILRVPGKEHDSTRGTTISAFVEEVDVVPTLLTAVGAEIPVPIQGYSLWPWLAGRKPAQWREAVYADWDYQFHFVGDDLGIPKTRRRAWMVRDKHFKYVHFLDLPAILFDLRRDPEEFHNVAGEPEYADTVAEYRSQLLEWCMATQDQSMAQVRWRERGYIGDFPITDRPNVDT